MIASRTTTLLAGCVLALVAAGCTTEEPAARAAAAAAEDRVAVYPTAGSTAANPATTISFRGTTTAALGEVVVEGSASGPVVGSLRGHDDGRGVSFVPDQPLEPGEEVVVRTDAPLVGGPEVAFTVATPGSPPDEVPSGSPFDLPEPEVLDLVTQPSWSPPDVAVEGDVGEDLLLTTPLEHEGVAPGAMITDPEGELVWWHPAPAEGVEVVNLVTDRLDGRPVLTWYEGTTPYGPGRSEGEWVVVDDTYTEVARIDGANGIPPDLHDIELTDRGTAIVVAYHPVVRDLTDLGGAEDALVLEAVVQEVDVDTGDVHLEWHSLDHIPIEQTRAIDPAEDPIVDYAHINSVVEGADGDLLISLRHTSQIMEVDRTTGQPEWVMGGDANSVDVGDDRGISYPHHARWLPDGTLSVFDNGVEFDPPTSRGVVYRMSADGRDAEVVSEYADDPPVYTATQGSVEVGDEGTWAMWSELGTATRFDGDGQPVGSIDVQTDSYRLFTADWTATPAAPPDVVVDGDRVVVSWNGATEVAAWQLVTADEDPQVLATADREGFETPIDVPAGAGSVVVQAVDDAGEVLGASDPVAVG